MDRPVDAPVLRRRRQLLMVRIGSGLAVVILGWFLLRAWVAPSIRRADIRTAVVDSGLVEASVSAAGNVVPEYEEIVSSPGDTRILRVLRKPGEQLHKGDQFLLLDVSEVKLALGRTTDNLALKANKTSQLRLDMERSIAELKNQLHIKELNVNYLKSKTAQQQRLLDLGASSKDQFDNAKLAEEIAVSEQEALKQNIAATEESLANQLKGLETEVATLNKEKSDVERQLEILSCRATRDGVLTMVNQDIGGSVHKGDIVARIADLSSFRVDAQTSDIHANEIAVGMPAHIFANRDTMQGTVSNITPAVENGIMKFSVGIAGRQPASLRANLRVDVAVVTAVKGRALRVSSGPYLNGGGAQEVFVVHGDDASRVTATIGVAGFDFVEVVNGLAKGDEVIVSDMRDYLHVKEIHLR